MLNYQVGMFLDGVPYVWLGKHSASRETVALVPLAGDGAWYARPHVRHKCICIPVPVYCMS